jgi:hypothetical protein
MIISKPEQRIVENGILYLFRTPEQVEEDLTRLTQKYRKDKKNDEEFKEYWRKLLSARIPVCPVCAEVGGPIRKTVEGEILGCDRCLTIAGYYETEPSDDLIGLKEAAEIIGWDPRKVATYRSRGSFPEPIAELAMGPVWRKSQIEKFKEKKNA